MAREAKFTPLGYRGVGTPENLEVSGDRECGSAAAQTFSYDPFGNITKNGSPYAFNPTYSTSTNRMTAVGSFTPLYDNDGNVTNDGIHAYAWDAYGNSTTLDSVGLTFDAFDRMVEQNRSGAYTQIVYSPTGFKMSIFINGQTYPADNFVPNPGGATIVYPSSGTIYVRHPDWLGSSRFASTTSSRTMYSDYAYSPFGEPYASSGAIDPSFTGQDQDATAGLYDFPFREHDPNQSRWTQPDPAGLAAVDPSNPQSWNRYAYVLNNPLAFIDPFGWDYCSGNSPYTQGGGSTNNLTPPDCAPGAPIFIPDFLITVDVWAPFGDDPSSCPPGMDCGYGPWSSGTSGGGAGGGGNTIIGDVWNRLKNAARTVGNYILVPCGAGAFTYGGGRGSGGGPVSTGVYSILSVDSRTGLSKGLFTDISAGEGLQGGVGQAKYTDGSIENFYFAGVGGSESGAALGVSLYVSHISGSPWYQFQAGGSGDAAFLSFAGGGGSGVNSDSLTSCVEHGFH